MIKFEKKTEATKQAKAVSKNERKKVDETSSEETPTTRDTSSVTDKTAPKGKES